MKIVQQIKAFLNIVYFLIRQFGLRPHETTFNKINISSLHTAECCAASSFLITQNKKGAPHRRLPAQIETLL
jgi:hypothetical protein